MNEKRYVRWTPEEVNILERFAKHGLSLRVTAGYLNRTVAAVAQKASYLRISFHGGPGGAPVGNRNRHIGELRKRSQVRNRGIK